MPGSRRRSGCLIVVLVLVLVVCGVAVVADRAVANTVESRLADSIATGLRDDGTPAQTTKVETEGFPFLTQLLTGKFDGGQVHLTNLRTADGGTLDKVDLTLHDVRVPRDVLTGATPHNVTVASIVGSGRLTVAEIAKGLELPGLKLTNDGNALKASFPTTIPVAGSIPITANLTPHLTNNVLTFDVSEVTAAGITIPQSVIDNITASFRRPAPLDLPFAVKLEKVTAGGGYVTVIGSANNVAIVK